MSPSSSQHRIEARAALLTHLVDASVLFCTPFSPGWPLQTPHPGSQILPTTYICGDQFDAGLLREGGGQSVVAGNQFRDVNRLNLPILNNCLAIDDAEVDTARIAQHQRGNGVVLRAGQAQSV